ncbi:DUF6223 family protein [Micromonospora sp. DT44]|uniref:DUF6223 family protein n=1 Tax=Micromonospora sp. DT44 TaxID=3393439 RepID=UPI003CFAD6E9
MAGRRDSGCRTTGGRRGDTIERHTTTYEKEKHMSVFTAATSALSEGVVLAADPMAASVTTMSTGRLGASVGGLLGLAGVIVGALALARPTSRVGTGSGMLGATVALASGLLAVGLGALVVATSDSGIGTGNGRGGAYVALVVGLAALGLGGLALRRVRA